MRSTPQCRCHRASPLQRWQSVSGGARNAGIFAAQILALKHPELQSKLEAYKTKLDEGVGEKAARLAVVGYENY